MLSLTPPIPKPTLPNLHRHGRHRLLKTLSASSSSSSSFSSSYGLPSPPPPPPPGADLYQPFRPPPSPLPSKYRSLDPGQCIDILRNRLGRWYEYAPLISSLSRDGFTPPSIEELTGITGVEQNRLAVASRVRESLAHSSPDLLPSFDHASAADLLYELRLLNSAQRASAARYAVASNLDGRSAQELARAIKDFPRRRGDDGWRSFSADSPADCLAYTYFRLSGEAIDRGEKISWLEKAVETAETDNAKTRIGKRVEKVSGKGEDAVAEEEELVRTSLPVVRLRYGEVAEAASVALLPVCKAKEGVRGVKNAPEKCKWEGVLGVVAAEKGWGRWLVLPGWAPVLGLGGEGGVAVEFADARALPWRMNRWAEEEGVVVVVDRKRREVGEGFYLVSGEVEGEVGVERGSKVGVKEVLGAVVLVVRPPKEEDDQLTDEDWD